MECHFGNARSEIIFIRNSLPHLRRIGPGKTTAKRIAESFATAVQAEHSSPPIMCSAARSRTAPAFIEKNGGKLVGSVRTPLGATG